MRSIALARRLTPLALMMLLTSCADAPPRSTDGPEAAPAADDAAERGARTLPIPPPAAATGTSTASDAPEDGEAAGLHWAAPADWVAERPSSEMRLAQYRVPGPGGDAECIVFYFGPGQGGDALSNAVRWAGQFRQPDGSSSVDRMLTTQLASTRLPVQLVEVTGIYDGGMTMTDAPAAEKPGYMLLGAVVEGPDAPWFFKFTGPETTVRVQRNAFVELLESLRTEP